MSGVSFSQNTEPDYERILNDIQRSQIHSGVSNFILPGGTKCAVSLNDGILNGQWKSYYDNGRKKAMGKYVNGLPVGRWKLWSSDGKQFLVIELGDKVTYSVRRIRKGFLKNPVLWGRGVVNFSFSERYGEVHYRKGLKEGKVIEADINEMQTAFYEYENGMYHGKCYWINDNGDQQNAEYNYGTPVGIWQLIDKKGELIVEKDYVVNIYENQIHSRPFIADHEIIWKEMTNRVVCSGHLSNNELFETDTNGVSLVSILDQAFVNDETVFYSDKGLSQPLFHSTRLRHVSGLDPEILQNSKPIMIYFYDLQYFSSQTSNMKNMILHFTVVLECKKEDEVFYKALPYAYFPMMYREIGAHTLHDQPLSVYFDKLLHGEYYSVLIYEQNNNQQYKYENFSDNQWIHESFKDDLFRIDRMHELWMKMAGIELK